MTRHLDYDRLADEYARHRAFSCLHLISTEGFQKGIQQMERD